MICYESMVKDPKDAIRKLAEFLGCEVSPEIVDNISHLAHFETMKKVPTVNMSWIDQFRDKKDTSFMRKGVAGDWRNYFTREQSAWMDAQIMEKIPKDCGLKFDFGDDWKQHYPWKSAVIFDKP